MTDLFSRAESHETAAELSVASGSSVFERALRRLPITAALFARALDSEQARYGIAKRVSELAGLHIDLRFRHPHDIALAIYLWVLDAVDQNIPAGPRVGRIAATVVLRAGQNCSWANLVARGIRANAVCDGRNTSLTYGSTDPEVVVMHSMETRIDAPSGKVLQKTAFGAWLLSPVGLPEETEYLGDSSNVAALADSGTAAVSLSEAA